MRIHLVRHGETENPDKIVYGTRPFPLTPLGVAQAEAAGVRLGQIIDTPSRFTSSPVRRAEQTSSIAQRTLFALRSYNGYPDVGFTDPDLTEAVSMFDGKKITNVVKNPRTWRNLRNPYNPSWNEDYYAMALRMERAVRRALQFPVNRDAVLVGHQLPIWVFRLSVEGRPFFHDPAARQCGHASVTTITYDGTKPVHIEYWKNPLEA